MARRSWARAGGVRAQLPESYSGEGCVGDGVSRRQMSEVIASRRTRSQRVERRNHQPAGPQARAMSSTKNFRRAEEAPRSRQSGLHRRGEHSTSDWVAALGVAQRVARRWSSASYGPISVVSMAFTTVGALALGFVLAAYHADASGRWSVRVCACRSATGTVRERLVVWIGGWAGNAAVRGRLRPLRPRCSSTRATTSSGRSSSSSSASGLPRSSLQRGQEHGRVPALDHGAEVRRSGVSFGRGAVLHRQRQLRPVERERREVRSTRSAAGWPSPCSATWASSRRPSRQRRSATPIATFPARPCSGPSRPPWSTCSR